MIWFRFLGSEHRTAQRALTDFNARFASQANRLAIKRGMVKILVGNGLSNETVCEHPFFNKGYRRWRSAHSGFLATGARTFLPLGELHERFDGFDGEAFAAFVADEISVPTALGQVHSRVGRAMIVPDGADFLAEERAPLWRKTFCVSHQGGNGGVVWRASRLLRIECDRTHQPRTQTPHPRRSRFPQRTLPSTSDHRSPL